MVPSNALKIQAPLPVGAVQAVRAFGGGIAFILFTPSIWIFALVPAGLVVAIVVGLSYLGFWGANEASTTIFGDSPSFWGHMASWAMTGLLTLVALILASFTALVLAQPLSGFALDTISRAQERTLTGWRPPPPSFFGSLANSLKVVLVTVAIGGSLLTVLFVINFFFPPALAFTVPCKLFVCGWLLAWDFFDYPWSRRGLGVRDRLKWVGRNFAAFSVFGIVWASLMVLPGMVLLLLPMGVAGATRLVVAGEPRRLEEVEAFGSDENGE